MPGGAHFRMHAEAPDAFDIRKEKSRTPARYGKTEIGRSCLLSGGWWSAAPQWPRSSKILRIGTCCAILQRPGFPPDGRSRESDSGYPGVTNTAEFTAKS